VTTSSSFNTLEPQAVWKNFSLLSAIIHPSGHLKKISVLIQSIGKKLKLEVITDKTGNILIKKPATTPDKQHQKPIVLQAHVDILPEIMPHSEYQVSPSTQTRPIPMMIDNDWMREKTTTLGVSDGIGVALILAILESKNIKHGPIEALFTIDKETQQIGVATLPDNLITGDTLINLSIGPDHVLFTGCTGSMQTNVSIPYSFETSSKHNSFMLSVSGIRGGHSACDIAQGIANAINIIVRLLWDLQSLDIHISTIFGGTPVYNAIPRSACAFISISEKNTQKLSSYIQDMRHTLWREYHGIEKEMDISLTPRTKLTRAIESNTQKQVLTALFSCVNGIIEMSPLMPHLPETSNNFSYISAEEGLIKIFSMQRSLVDSAKINTSNKVKAIFEIIKGSQIKQEATFPAWSSSPNSHILKEAIEVYRNLFHKSPKILSSHAGLECGYLQKKYPHLDMISFGPNVMFSKSPNEKVSISSVKKTWQLLCAILEQHKIDVRSRF
jgi:dipeptidase D